MNIQILVELSNQLKSLPLTGLTKEQNEELLEIVGILDSSALILDEITYVYNELIKNASSTDESKIVLEDTKPKEKVSKELDYPTYEELISALTSLKETLVNGQATQIQNYLDKLVLSKQSSLSALAYLKKLDYVFKEEPKIILLN